MFERGIYSICTRSKVSFRFPFWNSSGKQRGPVRQQGTLGASRERSVRRNSRAVTNHDVTAAEELSSDVNLFYSIKLQR